jgi:hypothetical protein
VAPGAPAGEQRTGVGQNHRIVVRVHDPAFPRDLLRHLMHAARRGQAGADIQELADARLAGQVAHRPGQERLVSPHRRNQVRISSHRVLSCLPVHGEVVFPARQQFWIRAICATLVQGLR